MITILLIIIYMAFISLGLPDAILGSAWPVIYQEIGVPVSYAGIIFMIISGGTIVSSFFSEKIINRLGTGLVTFISVLMTAAALFAISFGNHFLFFSAMAVPLGLGAGSVDAALNNYVALHFAAKHMSWLHCFWGVGATMGPMIMSLFLNPEKGTGNWQMGYRIIGFIQIALVIVLLISLPLWKKVQSGSQETKGEKSSIRMGEVLRLPGAKTILVSFFCYCAVEATVGLWGSSYLVISKGINAEVAARWVAIYYFGITAGRFLSGFLTMKFNNRNMIRLGQALLAAGVICLFLPLGNNILLAGFLLIGLGCAPIYPSLLHETPVNFGSRYSQAIMGIQMACAYVGSTVMPPLFGVLAAHISHSILPIYLLLLLILMVVMVEASVRRIKRSR